MLLCQLCYAVHLHHDRHQQLWDQKSTKSKRIADLKKEKVLFTSNDTNAKIEMYDRGPERSEHHAGADQDSSDHNHRSAAIAVDKYATHRS